MENELNVLSVTNSPNIMKVYDLLEDDINYYIVTELLMCDLLTYFKQHRESLDLRQQVRILHDIVLAVNHAHEAKIVHRDLKLENVLVASDGSCKLADFGFAVKLKAGE
jgi:serine/threonine-protein kinase